jgi:hypothetical protein
MTARLRWDRGLGAGVAVVCAVLVAAGGCSRAPSEGTLTTVVTFYAAYDNDPPGSTAIAFPNDRHSSAGGVGTFADPITFATAPDLLAVGTVIYYPPLRKYFVMEDLCASCTENWESTGTPHIDLWTGAATDPGVVGCEEALTPDDPVDVELDPPADRPVDTTPLYQDGRCIVAAAR